MEANHFEGNQTESTDMTRRQRAERTKTLRAMAAKLREQASRNPEAALAIVGAGAFVVGGLMGSRLGRFAMAAALPLVVSRALDGKIGEELARLIGGTNELSTSRQVDMR